MRGTRFSPLAGLVLALSFLGAGCNGPGGLSQGLNDPGVRRDPATIKTDALIYNGDGTANNGGTTLGEIAAENGWSYDLVDSDELNEMSLDEIASYGIIVWPGGKATGMSNSLTKEARARVRQAIQERGVSYAGFCAGSYIAGIFPEMSPTWGIQALPIEFFPYDHPQGLDSDILTISFADGSKRELAWLLGGPEMTGFGVTAATYPDGTPAVAEGFVGKGFMILTGPHPEAPEGWKYGFDDADGQDHDVAWKIMQAAYKQEPLPHI